MTRLFIVPTPIGNIKDITIRALETLKNTKSVICEDSRVTKKLLKLLEIDYSDKDFFSLFEGQEEKRVNTAIEIIKKNDTVLVSDSGTPLISDPGFRLVREINLEHKDEIQVEVLPGSTSLITALVSSGFPTDKFMFVGFLPHKAGQKKNLFTKLHEIHQKINTTFIAFESPHRIEKTVLILKEIIQDIEITLCKELTKLHENVIRGNPDEILKKISKREIVIKGEFIILFRFYS